jgi:uncharacterized protein YajQ (UPF0234 family)
MAKKIHFLGINLQLFAEGAGGTGAGASGGGTGSEGAMGVTGAAAMSQKSVKSNPLADVKYGIQAEDAAQNADVQTKTTDAEGKTTETADRNAEYAKFKNEYKDLYDADVQGILTKRLAKTKGDSERLAALSPTLETLGKKYGVDPTDIDALNKAIEEDDAYYEEEALEKGITVDQLKEIRKMEKENAELRKQMQEEKIRKNADQLYAKWMNESEALKKIYPSFDLKSEMQNPKFMDLLKVPTIDVKTAYEAVHLGEIMPAAMQFTAKTVEQKIANKIAANGARPTENGISSQSASVTKSDVSQLTKADRQEVIRRVARGDKISFG